MDDPHTLLKATLDSLRSGRLDEARELADRSVVLGPRVAVAWRLRAQVCRAQADTLEAEVCLRRSLDLDPTHAQTWASLADVLRELGRLQEPLLAYIRAIELAPQDGRLLAQAGIYMVELGQLNDAEGLLRSAVASGGGPSAVAGLVTVRGRRGDSAGALTLLEQVGDEMLRHPDVALSAARVYRGEGRHLDAVTLLESVLATRPGPGLEVSLQHALASSRDALGEHSAAFAAWSRANELRGLRFDSARWSERVEQILQRYDAASLQKLATGGVQDRMPILVVGMPRSGTTLTERILARHSQVAGCGELDMLREVAQTLPWPLTQDALAQGGRRYLDHLASLAGDKPRAVDKMPHNFLYLGEAAALMPKARVVICRRDPMDTCFSCFRTHLQGSHDYATSLPALGAFWRGFDQLARHWAEHLPLPTLELHYERLVNDLEGESRRLLAFLDLPWEPACLSFHEGEGVVASASYAQVRQPLYTSSVGRARPYAEYLKPLRQALDPH